MFPLVLTLYFVINCLSSFIYSMAASGSLPYNIYQVAMYIIIMYSLPNYSKAVLDLFHVIYILVASVLLYVFY